MHHTWLWHYNKQDLIDKKNITYTCVCLVASTLLMVFCIVIFGLSNGAKKYIDKIFANVGFIEVSNARMDVRLALGKAPNLKAKSTLWRYSSNLLRNRKQDLRKLCCVYNQNNILLHGSKAIKEGYPFLKDHRGLPVEIFDKKTLNTPYNEPGVIVSLRFLQKINYIKSLNLDTFISDIQVGNQKYSLIDQIGDVSQRKQYFLLFKVLTKENNRYVRIPILAVIKDFILSEDTFIITKSLYDLIDKWEKNGINDDLYQLRMYSHKKVNATANISIKNQSKIKNYIKTHFPKWKFDFKLDKFSKNYSLYTPERYIPQNMLTLLKNKFPSISWRKWSIVTRTWEKHQAEKKIRIFFEKKNIENAEHILKLFQKLHKNKNIKVSLDGSNPEYGLSVIIQGYLKYENKNKSFLEKKTLFPRIKIKEFESISKLKTFNLTSSKIQYTNSYVFVKNKKQITPTIKFLKKHGFTAISPIEKFLGVISLLQNGIKNFIPAFVVIFGVIALFIIFSCFYYTIAMKTTQLGFLKAIGMKSSQIYFLYIIQSWVIASCSCLLGFLLSNFLGEYIGVKISLGLSIPTYNFFQSSSSMYIYSALITFFTVTIGGTISVTPISYSAPFTIIGKLR